MAMAIAGSEGIINKRYCFAKLVVFIVLCKLMLASTAQDLQQLQPGDVLRDWESLRSPDGILKLGFFGASFSSYIYLGISIREGAYQGTGVIWVANRDTPLYDHSCVLNLGSDGSLTINSTSGHPIVLYPGQDSIKGNISLKLLNTGNLVLRAAGGDSIWQSFDYPTDTWLSGMKLGLFDLKSGQPRQQSLISWVSPFIPGPSGEFSLGVDPNNTKQLVILKRGVIYWRSGDWNGKDFGDLVSFLTDSSEIIFNHVSNENESYFTYTLRPRIVSGFLTLNSSGALDTSFMDHLSGGWSFGSYSCAMDNEYWTGGCARYVVKPSKCSMGDKFVPTTNFTGVFESSNSSMTIPISSIRLTINDCKEICMKNCSCIAYNSFQLDGTGCMFSTGTSSDGYISNYAYIRQRKKEKPLLVIILVPVIILMIVCLALSLYYLHRRKSCMEEKHNRKDRELLAFELGEQGDTSHPESDKDNRFPFFSFSVIKSATSDFSIENKLGQGGFGPVYKGMLQNGKEIAVKRLSRSSNQGVREFRNEVLLISKLQHRNLVRLLGCCIQGEERLLVYEYMPNNSLDSFIFDTTKRALLDWRKRFSIIQGIAQGLLYLHKYSRLRIIHRDLKTSNILLDNELNPKISDFGTARIFGDNESRANTGTIVGTYGYMSPEYAMEGLFSEKSDVFSYGVMMLEIIGSRKNTSFYHRNRFVNLLGYAWDLWKEGKNMELITDSGLLLEEPMPGNEVVRCIHIALMCVQDNAMDRPNMSEVVSMLTQDTMTLPDPKQPAFFLETSANEELTKQDLMPQSVNKVTISEIQGR